MQYLGYCTVCNCTNPSHSFNLTTPYFDTSPGHAGNPCAHSRFHFSFPLLNFTKTFSPFSHFNLAFSVTLPTLHSFNLHAPCLSVNLSSPFLAYPTQTHQQKQRKNSNSPCEISIPKHSHPF